ncbi:hypothetical protein P175DRAFT_0497015 [Aspergillus ochraceoroseus IBT 24754]|uniref:Something about silencing protein 4 domain-containing protein n=1 Tax=Aspergillus ochraceoroseus IBT 24754 TaxID=1392256 RepID=A0A2T5M5U4_9EURO|nr:uncharacterized protein P175DRAFT_0497015 [Aspergillus ochraceoroseus IBT 24754]PTU23901.1 hypothetical protein P175DRAFT_0497015 [Aspergillus ochraceoroseus IBT 24754]
MAVRSRSSLRVSLRQDPNDAAENLLHQHSPTDHPPPSKRLRLHPPPARRRKSSPDLLDTTIENTPSSASKLTLVRRSSARPRPPFGASAPSTSSLPSSSPHPPPPSSTPAPGTASFPRASSPHGSTPAPTQPRRRVAQAPQLGPEPEEPVIPPSNRPARGNISPTEGDTDSLLKPILPSAGTASPAVPEQRRSLRSHDGGSRARSELALYFPNYEEVLSLEPPKTEFLAGPTIIKLIDDLTEPPLPASTLSVPDADTPFGNPLIQLHGCEVITLPDPLVGYSAASGKDEDPLNEEHYFKAHRRNERQEKQLRNIERDRAQHEKQHLDRLLDELQSHDWLRVMGITSLTDHDKKLYEPKRDYFVQEISALLQKFKIWKEEERRRKLEKDKPSSFPSDIAQPPEPTPQAKTSVNHPNNPDEPDEMLGSTPSNAPSSGEPSDTNDVDALAARQLLQEARSATAGKRPKPTNEGRKKPSSTVQPEPETPESPPPPLLPPPPPEPEKPFTSFFSKPHVRELAMSKTRKGRARLAFGLPLPELEEREFELPSDILTPEAIASCQRKRRRMKRASKG